MVIHDCEEKTMVILSLVLSVDQISNYLGHGPILIGKYTYATQTDAIMEVDRVLFHTWQEGQQ